MTESAAPIEHVRSDALPPITPAQAAAFQEQCAAAAAIHSARELGVIARISEAPADPAAVATYCGLTPQGATALLSALAGLDLLKLGDDGRFRPAYSGLDQLVELFRPWACVQPILVASRDRRTRRQLPVRSPSIRVSSHRSGLSSAQAPNRQPSYSPSPDSWCSTSATVQLPGASPSPRASPVPPSQRWTCRR